MQKNIMTKKLYATCNLLLNNGGDMTPLKLIKLAYISHGHCLALLDKPLFKNKIEVWPYGPVIPSLYEKITNFSKSNIANDYFESYDTAVLSDDEQAVIKSVADYHKNDTAVFLSDLTHQLGTPWFETLKNKGFYAKIGDDVIKAFYIQMQ